MKKLFALLLALTMVLSLATTAFADGEYPGASAPTYTISAPAGSTHTYEVYQIFAGTLNTEGNKLSDLCWGENAKQTEEVKAGEEVEESYIKELTDVNSKTEAEKLAVILTYVDLESKACAKVTADNPASVMAGYYLIKDVSTTATENETLSTYIVQVAGNVEIDPKAKKPESEKKVMDVNDSTNETTDWQDSADYDIDDAVPFQITFTLPEDYASYTNYKVIVHDRQSAGLSFNKDSVKIFVNNGTGEYPLEGFDVTSGADVEKCAGCEEDDDQNTTCTFHIACDDIKTLRYNNNTALKAEDKIIFKYNSTLNANAQFGATGNPNEMDIEFSNEPYGIGTTNTPDDVVIVFTYKLDVNKVDGENKPLAGAKFKLEKKMSDGNWKNVELTTNSDDSDESDDVNDIGTIFSAKGLDDGDYRITETTTPDGYNTIAPIEFTVTAEHEITITSTNGVLTSLNGNVTDGTITWTSDVPNGSLSTDVVNKSGTELPETGGMGTTLFYIVGGIMVAAAAVLLVTKKRMSVEA